MNPSAWRALPAPARGRACSGFTLVELLVVMSIMAVLLGMVVPASRSLYESSNIAQGGQLVTDQLIVARQYAASKNQAVEVRFIAAHPGLTGYNAVQLWYTPTSGTPAPLDKAVNLPSNIEISANSKLSPLVSTGALAGTAGTMPSSGATPGATYVSFTVRPTGIVLTGNANSANAPAGSAVARQPSYFFTILPNRYDTASTLPTNYLIIQVNPDTAYAGVFQP